MIQYNTDQPTSQFEVSAQVIFLRKSSRLIAYTNLYFRPFRKASNSLPIFTVCRCFSIFLDLRTQDDCQLLLYPEYHICWIVPSGIHSRNWKFFSSNRIPQALCNICQEACIGLKQLRSEGDLETRDSWLVAEYCLSVSTFQKQTSTPKWFEGIFGPGS